METTLPLLLGLATLLPLASFFIILVVGPWLEKYAAYVATGAIVIAGALAFASLAIWVQHRFPAEVEHLHAGGHGDASHHGQQHQEGQQHHQQQEEDQGQQSDGQEHAAAGDQAGHAAEEHLAPISSEYYVLGVFGKLRLSISCYIDALTICMFCMVTLIASCIHFYSMGYMHEEEHEVTDHEVTLRDGTHLTRPGRYPRFFQYMSLFCFSMLGLVLSGNIAMVFVFWELVGICSYFLIGFYVERHTACNAANKAFIVNRIGDFGMIIGLMVLWSCLGTFAFGDVDGEKGIFSQLRAAENDYRLQPAAGMIEMSAGEEVGRLVAQMGPEAGEQEIREAIDDKIATQWRGASAVPGGAPYGYWLLVIAGVGIFCGCVGKSAQFPLHVWLPDAMEGPTPVSALVHSATMVAAGVYLVGRFYPVFAPEVLLVIAVAGCITLFMAATIAVTATDIKRVLAYSTVSQLGYMMLSLGVGGWIAGMMHLITHAFFKSLLFLCSGSVIHAVHSNEMTDMGGLRKKMPITAVTMLIGCLAIAGAGVPFVVGFSGYYSKDKILEQAYSFLQVNAGFWSSLFFVAAAGGAAITAFYMFRLWYMTFAGQPRDQHRYEHAHESPRTMYIPLIILAVFAIGVAWRWEEALLVGIAGVVFTLLVSLRYLLRYLTGSLAEAEKAKRICLTLGGISLGLLIFTAIWTRPGAYLVLEYMLEQARPAGTLPSTTGQLLAMQWPSEPDSHAYATPITILAFGTAVAGFALATVMYGLGYLNPADVRQQFAAVYRFLINKWWFDELYDVVFVRPTHVLARMCAGIDRRWIDGLVDWSARATSRFADAWDRLADQTLVDGLVNLMASWTYSIGLSLRSVQTGRIRQYVVFIVLGTIVVYVLVSIFWNPALAS